MAAVARWMVSMAETDKEAIETWAARCERLGVAASVAGALRKAVEIAESATDDDVRRGYV